MISKDIKALFKGRTILPGDADYDNARTVFYGGIDKKPAVIIKVANAEDVKKSIMLAKDEKLELAVRSGGHSVAGYSTTDGGIVIDLRELKKLEINTKDNTATAETGLTAMDVTTELDKHNLVLGFGDTGSVGIGGITLGGGVGFLVRKFGLTVDNLLSAEIVTANGEILNVDSENHPDLFWAIRGGGGNFGVATKFKFKLHELGECYGGLLLLPANRETISGCIDIAKKSPKELSAIFNVMPTFPMPQVPKEYHGKLSVMALIVYAGDPKMGEKVVAPIRALAKPITDQLRVIRYKDIFFPEQENYHPLAVSRTMHLNDVDLNVGKVALDWLDKIEAPMKALQLRVLGGAMAKVPEDETAYANRKSPIMANIAAFYQTPEEKTERQIWVNDFSNAIYQGDNSAYVGFLGPAEQDRLSDAYPVKTLEKLKEVKRKYDPENIFKLNFNINPKQ